jgi:hypothetical protein
LKINLITPPDKIYSDSMNMLLLYPKKDLLDQLQNEILPSMEIDMNIFLYESNEYSQNNIEWIMSVFSLSDIVIADVDNCVSFTRDLLSYMIAKPKTYWLTNAEGSVYNQLSSNRIYNLSFLLNLGVRIEEELQ